MFGKRRDIPRGYQYLCKQCANLKNKLQKQSKPKGYYSQRARDYQKRWIEQNPLANKKSVLKTRYGISLEQYQKMVIDQGNKCKICGRNETVINRRTGKVQTLSVDHCHEIGKVRGLLCQSCNHAIGKFRDDPLLCRRAADYLESRL
jgi:hypothetical protein